MPSMKQFLLSIWEVVEIFLVVFISLFIIKVFAQPFVVSGASMEPTFSDKDYLLIDGVSYAVHPPERGDVIVFRPPGISSTFYIKRVVGLPEERVVVKDGVVSVYNKEYPEGFSVDTAYFEYPLQTTGDDEFILGENQYFVLGDNRSQSSDSRSWGPLTREAIVGKVRLRFWPLTELDLF